jgi:hypothetical protein
VTVSDLDPRLIADQPGLAGAWAGFRRRLAQGELGTLPVIVGIAVIWAIFQAANHNFLTPGNLTNLVLQIAAMGTIAVGVVLVLLLGEIDLSVGAVSGLCAAIMAVLSVKHGWNPYLAMVAAILGGAAIGLFGPVVAVIAFEDEADAVRIANDTPYGLSGSIWTENGARALRVARALETGVLSVNSNTSVRVATPFGGFKQSGFGRELGMHALEGYSELKNVYVATEP